VRDRLRRLGDATWRRLSRLALAWGLAWGTWAHICDRCPSIAQIYAFEPKEATRVYAADGSLVHEFAIERRTAVTYASIPEHVADAFISVEDRRFWSHRSGRRSSSFSPDTMRRAAAPSPSSWRATCSPRW
jgi:membrane carboxypeptidase/penicillin-binding protein